MKIRRPLDQGWVLSSQDYASGEMVTHGQSCIWLVGHSDLATALLNNINPHEAFACTMLGIELKDFDKKIPLHNALRQSAKVPNFAMAGGGGDVTLVQQYRKQGEDTPHPEGPSMVDDGRGNLVPGFKGTRFCTLMRGVKCGVKLTQSWKRREKIDPTCVACLECMGELREIWKRQWSENPQYFDFISDCVDNGMLITPEMIARWPDFAAVFEPYQQLDPMQIAQHVTARIRKVGAAAETPFCVLANTFFSALLADITKHAHRICVRECWDRTYRVPEKLFWNSRRSKYAGGPSPLFGHGIRVFAHDELLGEHPRGEAHDGSTRITEVMVDVMRYYCPDVADAAKVDPTLMNEWTKGADKVVHDDRVVPWTRHHDVKTCVECAVQKARDERRRAA